MSVEEILGWSMIGIGLIGLTGCAIFGYLMYISFKD